jgi:hypothetical protein
MTEGQWLASDNVFEMLEFLEPTASGRKFRLLAVSFCRRVWELITDQGSRDTLEIAERCADGDASKEQLGAAWRAAGIDRKARLAGSENAVPSAVWAAVSDDPSVAVWDACWHSCRATNLAGPNDRTQTDACIGLVRDVFGNPFRPPRFEPASRTPIVASLAQSAYEERILPSGELESARLAVLADALEDAGCTDGDILSHLRSAGPHVRGCWAVDLILGKQ